jgi:hypothetical protein
MIVPSMTLNEIHKELFNDLRTLKCKFIIATEISKERY